MRASAFLVALPCALAACAAPDIAIVPPALGCPVPAALAQPCSPPRDLLAPLSYADLLQDYQADRQSLASCVASQRDVMRVIAACQVSLAAYNASLGSRAAPHP